MSRRSLGLIGAAAAIALAALVSGLHLQPGLIMELRETPGFESEPVLTLRDRAVSLERRARLFPFDNRHYSVRWHGSMRVRVAGEHRFTTRSDDGSWLWVDDVLVVDNGGMHGARARSGTIDLAPGFHRIRLQYVQGGGDAFLAVGWQPPGGIERPLGEASLVAADEASVARQRWAGIAAAALAALVATGVALVARSALRRRAWREIDPATWRLALFLAVAVLGATVAIGRLTPKTSFYARFFLELPTHGRTDSWAPMQRAVQLLAEEPGARLYRRLFFDEHVKFQYPPTSLLLLEPVREWSTARLALVANGLSWLVVAWIAFALERIYSLALVLYAGRPPPAAGERALRLLLAAGFTLGFYPIVRSWWGGQIQTLLAGLFSGALWAWLAGRRTLAGMLVGAVCVVKPQLGLLAIWGALRRDGRFVAGLLVTAGAFGVVSLARYGLADHLDYLEVLSYIARHGESYAPNQSVNGVVHRLLGNGNNLHWVGDRFAPYHPVVHAATVASTLALIGAALFWRRPKGAPVDPRVSTLDLLIAALSFTMASPVAWQHHYNVLLPMLAVALAAAMGRVARGSMVALAIALLAVGIYLPAVDRFAGTPASPLQSHLFAGALLALLVFYRLRKLWVGATLEEDRVAGG